MGAGGRAQAAPTSSCCCPALHCLGLADQLVDWSRLDLPDARWICCLPTPACLACLPAARRCAKTSGTST